MCSSYRPLGLLNVDVKILAKVLAQRLEVVLPEIISEEQTGFITGRYSFFNICSHFNIIILNYYYLFNYYLEFTLRNSLPPMNQLSSLTQKRRVSSQ